VLQPPQQQPRRKRIFRVVLHALVVGAVSGGAHGLGYYVATTTPTRSQALWFAGITVTGFIVGIAVLIGWSVRAGRSQSSGR
jgi:hypothetical protein